MPFIEKYTDLDMSFRRTFRNDVRKKVDEEAINQHLRLLILTEQDEIPFENNVSADVRNLLFENYTVPVQEALSSTIRNILKQYEPRITVQDVINTANGNDLELTVTYVIKQTRVVGQFKTILKRAH